MLMRWYSYEMPVQIVKTRDLLFVCKSCAGGKRLRRDLKTALKKDGRKDVRVVSCDCLDVCPQRAVTVTRAPVGRPASTVVVDRRATLEEILAR
jgi:predicted metal-binding protein